MDQDQQELNQQELPNHSEKAALRQVNRLIAESFFNWRVFTDRSEWEAAGSPRGRLVAFSENGLPQYSSHLETAWQLIPLVCRPRPDGKWMTFLLELDELGLWTVEFALKEEYDVAPDLQAVLGNRDTRTLQTYRAQSRESAALAICEAALKARGIDLEVKAD